MEIQVTRCENATNGFVRAKCTDRSGSISDAIKFVRTKIAWADTSGAEGAKWLEKWVQDGPCLRIMQLLMAAKTLVRHQYGSTAVRQTMGVQTLEQAWGIPAEATTLSSSMTGMSHSSGLAAQQPARGAKGKGGCGKGDKGGGSGGQGGWTGTHCEVPPK